VRGSCSLFRAIDFQAVFAISLAEKRCRRILFDVREAAMLAANIANNLTTQLIKHPPNKR
jgi:hypothetical protein